MLKKKKTASGVNSELDENDEAAVIESVDVEADAVATTSSSGTSNSSDGDHKLQQTPVPRSKAAGKRSSEKSEFQGQLLDLLERDMQASKSSGGVATEEDDDDPVDLQLMSMSKRIKKELPAQERFTVLLKLQQILHENIEAVNRCSLINATPLLPDGGQSFLQMGNQEAVVQTRLPMPPPPMLQQQPNVQMVQHSNVSLLPPPMVQQQQQAPLQMGSNVFERTLSFQDI